MAASIAVVSLLLAAIVAAHAADSDTTHLSFFMHDVVSGSNPTSVQVIRGPSSSNAASSGASFGDTSVMDNALTETSSPTSSPVGRMQGVYMLASQTGAVRMVTANILLTSGDANGSTIAVVGREDTADAGVRELSVIGGTGKFRMVNGYVLWKTAATNGPDSTVQLDVYLAGSDGNTTIDASAPVSPVGGGGSASGSGSGGSTGTKSSSGAAGSRVSSSAGWVVAVAAAAVGSSWVW